MIAKTSYIEQLGEFINKSQIKILTGIRRSGKSSVLSFLKETLLKQEVSISQIVHINMESFAFSELRNAVKLYDYVAKNIQIEKKHIYCWMKFKK